jgi:hypothetical protein
MVFLFDFKSSAKREAAGKETAAIQKGDPINDYDKLLSVVRETVYSVKGVGFGRAVVTMDGDELSIALFPSVSKEYSLKIAINKAILAAVNNNPNSKYLVDDSGWLNITKGNVDMIYKINEK